MSEAIQYSNDKPEELEGGKQLPDPSGFIHPRRTTRC